MFAPGGVHTVNIGGGDGSVEVTLRIDESTAPVLNASLARFNRENAPQRAFFDREHDQSAGATAWPTRFVWDNSPVPAVYVEHEPSSLGLELISGKIIRAFSPAFFADAALPKKINRGQHITVPAGKRGSPENPARMTGLVFPACGTLTNDPGFRKILPLWAKNAGRDSAARLAGAPSGQPTRLRSDASVRQAQQPNKNNMTNEEKAALQAKKIQLEQDIVALKAQDQTDAAVAEQLAAKTAELELIPPKLEADELRARNAELESAVLAQRTKDAEAAVKAAVKRGAIAPRDDALQAKWQKRCTEDPENIELLACMKGSPALGGPSRIVIPGDVKVRPMDAGNALLAYHQEKNPRQRGIIYASEIAPLLAKHEPVPFNSPALRAITNVAGTLVGDIISQRTLELVFSIRPVLRAITTDFSDEPAKVNQVIRTRTVGLPTIQDLGGTVSDVAEVDVPVTLNLLKEARFQLEPAEWAGTNRSLIDEHAEAMAVAIGNYLVDELAKLWDDTYTAETLKAVAAIDYTTISAMVRAMNIAGVPDIGRWGCVNSYVAEAFRNDELIMEHFDRNQGSGYAHWTNIEGFRDIWEFPALPNNSVNVTAMFGSKSACVAAARLLANPENLLGLGYPGQLSVVTEPVSGLSVLKNTYVTQANLQVGTRLILLGGVDEGQIACGHKWVSA